MKRDPSVDLIMILLLIQMTFECRLQSSEEVYPSHPLFELSSPPLWLEDKYLPYYIHV